MASCEHRLNRCLDEADRRRLRERVRSRMYASNAPSLVGRGSRGVARHVLGRQVPRPYRSARSRGARVFLATRFALHPPGPRGCATNGQNASRSRSHASSHHPRPLSSRKGRLTPCARHIRCRAARRGLLRSLAGHHGVASENGKQSTLRNVGASLQGARAGNAGCPTTGVAPCASSASQICALVPTGPNSARSRAIWPKRWATARVQPLEQLSLRDEQHVTSLGSSPACRC